MLRQQAMAVGGVATHNQGLGIASLQVAVHVGVALDDDEVAGIEAALQEGVRDRAGAAAELEHRAAPHRRRRRSYGAREPMPGGQYAADAARIAQPPAEEDGAGAIH